MPGALPYCVSHCCSPGPFPDRKCDIKAAVAYASLDVQAAFKLDESEAREERPLPLFS